MKRIRGFRIGQVVGLGFSLILFLALLIGLSGRVAYDVSQRQRDVIQTRGDVEQLTLKLEILAMQRTNALRRYLESEDDRFLVEYQETGATYDEVFAQLAVLLKTPAEIEALQAVVTAKAAFGRKAEEVLRLYESQFLGSARFVWGGEGLAAQDNLTQTIERLRQVQGETSAQIINRARQTETLAVIIVSLFIGLVLITAVVTSFLITRSITRPLAHLLQATTAIGSDLTVQVKPSGPQEVAFLGETINEMAAHLLASRQSLQRHTERLEHELTLASQVQASFFPEALPRFPGLELAAFWQSAREIGGDFYTTIKLGHGQQAIVVGDVSGKGAPAAMAGALAVGLLEAYAPVYPNPETLLARLNKDLYTRFTSNYMNVACCYLILDTTSFCLTVANAGAVYPYLRHDGDLSEVDVFGVPLGMWPDYEYVPQSLALQPGDLLLLSSDGLIEARNEQGDLFGFERLQAELRKLPAGISAQATIERLVKAVAAFTGPADLQDDLTILVMHILER